MSVPHDTAMKALESLRSTIARLKNDELVVLDRIARRLLGGQQHYGALDLATDKRDFRKERAEELADAVVYTALDELKAEAERGAT